MKSCKALEMGNDTNNKTVKFSGHLVPLKEKN